MSLFRSVNILSALGVLLLSIPVQAQAPAGPYGQNQPGAVPSPNSLENPYADRLESSTRLPVNVFSVAGVPNESGTIKWPLPFRVLPHSDEVKELLDQINAQFLVAISQNSLEGRADRQTLRDLRDSLSQLRRIVATNEANLGQFPSARARDFLRKLDAAERKLE